MPGVKERSGGARPGAGRPCKTVSMKTGDEFYVTAQTPDGMLPGQLWTVIEVSRGRIVIKSNNGDTLILVH